MTLLALESWVALDRRIEVSRENVLDHPGHDDVLWFAVWQLDPVIEQVVGHPEHHHVHTFTSLLLIMADLLLLSIKLSVSHPVVILSSVDFASKLDTVSSTHDSKSLETLAEQVVLFFTEVYACPAQHLCFLFKVWHNELLVLR